MAVRGGQPGNKNATKGKPFRDALTRALVQNPNRMRNIVDGFLKTVESGDVSAVREFADRVDGKVVQGMDISLTEAIAEQLKNARERTGK